MDESRASASVWDRIHDWILDHDNRWSFVGAYLLLAVVLTIALSLFWLVAVVAVHFLFEWMVQRRKHTAKADVLAASLWEIKVDIALVLFALVLALYMDVVLGIAGLSSSARLVHAGAKAARTGSRLLAWERVLRGVLLSLDDLAQLIRAALGRRRKGNNAPEPADGRADLEQRGQSAMAQAVSDWRGPWGAEGWIAFTLGAACLVLIAATPLLTAHTAQSIVSVLAAELHPFPSGGPG
jgi:hypothetical protein